ncbi:MAG: hypothetical protein ACK5LL_06385 [Suipraeoptans sp.]
MEKKLDSLKANIKVKRFNGASFDTLFTDLKIVEGYVAELANIATLIHGINPNNRSNDFGYEYKSFTTHTESKKEMNEKPWKSSRFFDSCVSKENLVKKYRELAKIYHPDNATTGNIEIFKNFKAEYDEYIRQ